MLRYEITDTYKEEKVTYCTKENKQNRNYINLKKRNLNVNVIIVPLMVSQRPTDL